MPIPRAKIDNATRQESFRVAMWRFAQAFAALPPVYHLLSLLFALIGAAMVLSPVYAFWMRADVLGVALFGIIASPALWQLCKLPGSRKIWLPEKFFWALLLGVPVIGILFFVIRHKQPSRHDHAPGSSIPGV